LTVRQQEAMKSGSIPKQVDIRLFLIILTSRYTTVPNHSGDMPEGTLRAILKESGISPDEFLRKS